VLARDLAGAAPTIEESWTGGAVLDLCAAHPAIPSFAVLEGRGRVIGLIERERLYSQFSQPLWFDVYNRRPIAPLVTREAMVVDGTMPIEGVKELIACRYPQAISSGFAIVEQERYLGIGTVTALLEKAVDLGHLRAIELEEAHRKAEIASETKSRFLPKSEVRDQIRTRADCIARPTRGRASDFCLLTSDFRPPAAERDGVRPVPVPARRCAPGARAGGGHRRHAASADAAGNRAQRR
jgi:hypothetical protein